MRVGLLALQGAFFDHYRILESLGATVVEIRRSSDLVNIERLILPGGESTVMSKYIMELNLQVPLQALISQGLPVWGICAGCILMAHKVDHRPGILNALNIDVHRNAYGRQAQSSIHVISVPDLQRMSFPAPFIRAPQIVQMEESVCVHAYHGNDPVFVQQQSLMATTFHPELTNDPIFHKYFLEI